MARASGLAEGEKGEAGSQRARRVSEGERVGCGLERLGEGEKGE